MSWNLKEIFEPDWKKVVLSFVILFLALYLAPCKVMLAAGGNYWSICGKVVSFPEFLSSDAGGMQFSFFGVLELSDRMLLGMSFLVLFAYALSYAVSSLLVHYFKGRTL